MSVEVSTREPAVITKALSKIGDIATLPEVTLRVIEIVEDPRSTARDLHDVIKTDPALSAKILKVVNSAFYGLPGQIASVDRAIVMLGLSAVKNISIAASMTRLFRGDRLTEEFGAQDLWRHSVCVAVASRSIASAAGLRLGLDEMFLAGLIHDLGVLAERQAFAEKLAEVIRRCRAGDVPFTRAEHEVIGADHQQFGEALCAKWKFPRHLRAVVGYHHQVDRVGPEYVKLVTIVHLADVVACQERIGFYLSAQDEVIQEEHLEALKLDAGRVEEIRAGLKDAAASAEATLGSG